MTFTAGTLPIWPVTPDWTSGMRETLAWSTGIHRAAAGGVSQHVGERLGPRRWFAFDVLQSDRERRIADMLLAGRGIRPWLLPIWPDVQRTPQSHSAGAAFIHCRTAGFDFHPGGKALMYRSVTDWEVVSIDSVEPTGLGLASALVDSYAHGVRLYPLRRARIDPNVQLRKITDTFDRGRLSFSIDESCDWPAQLPAVQYLGHPVLEAASDAGEDGPVGYERLATIQDNGAALPVVFDVSGVPLRSTPHVWELWGREEHSAFRSLVYGLRGRQVPVWVPSGSADVEMIGSLGAAGALMTVEWCGYTQFGQQRPNRRDIRIELRGGTAFHRRVTGSAEAGGNEVLQLDAPLGQSITAGQVRRISFMALSTLASDEVEIFHDTDADGRGRAVAPWQSVVPDA